MEALGELAYRKSLFSVKKQDGCMGSERAVGRKSKPTTPEGHLGKLEDPILFCFFFFCKAPSGFHFQPGVSYGKRR